MDFNPLSAIGHTWKFYRFISLGPHRGYLGGSRSMLSCVTLCPLSPKPVKIPVLKGLNSQKNTSQINRSRVQKRSQLKEIHSS